MNKKYKTIPRMRNDKFERLRFGKTEGEIFEMIDPETMELIELKAVRDNDLYGCNEKCHFRKMQSYSDDREAAAKNLGTNSNTYYLNTKSYMASAVHNERIWPCAYGHCMYGMGKMMYSGDGSEKQPLQLSYGHSVHYELVSRKKLNEGDEDEGKKV